MFTRPLLLSPVRYIDIGYRLSIVDISTLLKNIDIDKAFLKNIDIDIDKEILENIDKILNRLEFGISNRATPTRFEAITHIIQLRTIYTTFEVDKYPLRPCYKVIAHLHHGMSSEVTKKSVSGPSFLRYSAMQWWKKCSSTASNIW